MTNPIGVVTAVAVNRLHMLCLWPTHITQFSKMSGLARVRPVA